ncbi:uncharacterized protein LOC128748801 isoform X2 [Synchiropus splendidus]|uniref:uncharacterized protein LOC128748801 isoform X2 n=1 Tax=Synchiropus splendidus TaxID=270530 RepID=UPI00237D67DB|nr:uncharacterized protein LOC128748801 isoform X2 [Synchiropus splendidus]
MPNAGPKKVGKGCGRRDRTPWQSIGEFGKPSCNTKPRSGGDEEDAVCGWLSLNDTAPTRRSGRITETLKWWDVVVPGFTNEEWLQNFRMAEETSCARKCVQQWRDDTPLSACVCRSRREWLLLCGSLLLARSTRILESALESASLLCSGVCWSFVLRQRRCWCQSKSVFQVKPGSEILPGTLRTHGGSHTAIDSFRIPITTPHDCLDSL